ncbi:MAG: YesL family protein [Erysipelotrichaceae bacterium]|nr:YesL family protein [Erysipelotrichaceae bacterium]
MNKKMNYESFLALGEKLTYIMALGLLFILCSLPIITIGASATALNKAMKLYVRYGEKRIFQAFFGAFIKFFKPATLVWLLNLVVILILCFDLLFYGDAKTWVQMAGMIVITISLMVVIFETTVSFVMISEELTKGVKDTIICALKYGLKCPFEGLMVMMLNLAIPGLLFLFMMELLILAPGVLTYLSWQFLPKSLDRYKKLMKM